MQFIVRHLYAFYLSSHLQVKDGNIYDYSGNLPVSLMFGYFIDFSMMFLGFIKPTSYFWNFVYLIIGCVILGIGVYIEVLANVIMLPGESFVER